VVFHATRAFRASLLALVLLQFLALQQKALAQVAGGTISGTVTDANGSVIPNAQITITNVETGIGRNAITNEAGIYITPNLLPGRYDIKFSAAGFKTQVRTGIALNVGTEEVIDLAMQVGAFTETVEVTTKAPDIQLSTSDISAVVNATAVRDLPLNGPQLDRPRYSAARCECHSDPAHTQELLHGNDGPPMIAVEAIRKVESDAYFFRLIRQHSSPS
jgi:hypothetical protein